MPERIDEPAGVTGDEDAWPEKPDAWDEADRRWAETWEDADAGDDDTPANALPRLGPREDPPNAIEAYAQGMHEAGPYLGLGLQIAGSMALFTGAGYFIDRALGTRPWGIIVGATLAFVGIIALVVRLGNRAGRKG